jgi:NAD(P)-dependent dehydrogenase (short-subunit alcohol dehydrogenase family)
VRLGRPRLVPVVAGASKGIGAGIAKGLAAEGAERVVADIKAKGGKAIAVQGDVAKATDADHVPVAVLVQILGNDLVVLKGFSSRSRPRNSQRRGVGRGS